MRGLLALGGAGLVAALASGHAELAVLGSPFSCSSGWASCSPTSRALTARIDLERTRLLEGEQVTATVTVW